MYQINHSVATNSCQRSIDSAGPLHTSLTPLTIHPLWPSKTTHSSPLRPLQVTPSSSERIPANYPYNHIFVYLSIANSGLPLDLHERLYDPNIISLCDSTLSYLLQSPALLTFTILPSLIYLPLRPFRDTVFAYIISRYFCSFPLLFAIPSDLQRQG